MSDEHEAELGPSGELNEPRPSAAGGRAVERIFRVLVVVLLACILALGYALKRTSDHVMRVDDVATATAKQLVTTQADVDKAQSDIAVARQDLDTVASTFIAFRACVNADLANVRTAFTFHSSFILIRTPC